MDGSMFIGTWWALVPPLLAILLAFITKEVYSSLFIGVAVGALLYSGFHPWESFVNFFEIMKDSMNLNILIFDVLLGMIIVLMAKSGGSAAYGKWAGTKIRSKRSALLATAGLGVLIFVDDYFNCLTVGSVMRPVTDRYKVSRAKLAYIIDATAAPVCIIAPVSSWAAAVNSYVPEDAGISGFQLFLSTIPYNLYAILTLVMVFYIAITAFDFGLMKKHEDNAAKGDLFTSGAEEFEQVSEDEVNPNGKVIDLVLPVAVLIVSAIGAMIYTGFLGGAEDIITAFSGCDAETSLIFATLVTVFFMLLLYLPRKVVTFKGFMDSLADGFKLMVPAVTPDLRMVIERHGRCSWACGFCGPCGGGQCLGKHLHPGGPLCGGSVPVVFHRDFLGDICDPRAHCHSDVLGRGGYADDGHLCLSGPGGRSVRGPRIADLGYNGQRSWRAQCAGTTYRRSRIQRSCPRRAPRATISTMCPRRCSMRPLSRSSVSQDTSLPDSCMSGGLCWGPA